MKKGCTPSSLQLYPLLVGAGREEHEEERGEEEKQETEEIEANVEGEEGEHIKGERKEGLTALVVAAFVIIELGEPEGGERLILALFLFKVK